jgi:hypothetical protein
VPWLLGPIIVSNKDCYIRVENILIAGFISLTRVTRQKHVTVVDIFILNWGEGGGSKVFKCPSCSWQIDRDINGARNILIRFLSEHLSDSLFGESR